MKQTNLMLTNAIFQVNQCVIYAVLTNGVDTSQPPSALLSAATANMKKY